MEGGEDKSRLAFEAGFQYHEWTFKQACVKPPAISLFHSLLLSIPLPTTYPPLSVKSFNRLGKQDFSRESVN